MGRYFVVSVRKRCGEHVDVPDEALGVSVVPGDRPGVLQVTYLTPVRRIAIEPPCRDRIDVDKQ